MRIVHKFSTTRNQNLGFTLIELLLYMSLMAIFLTVLTQIFSASIDTQLESESESSVQQDGKFMLARLEYDIARAQSITLPATSGASGQVLSLVVNGATVSYQLSGKNATLTDSSGTSQLNSTGTTVSNLQFVRRSVVNGKPVITVSFTLTSTTQRTGGANVQTFQTTIGTR
jgi:type II secretory pathway pseudopilin PulG